MGRVAHKGGARGALWPATVHTKLVAVSTHTCTRERSYRERVDKRVKGSLALGKCAVMVTAERQ